MRNHKGQTIVEYIVIIIIIIGVMVTMKDYIKRGIQGRWKAATDDLGEPYDPQHVNASITYSTQTNSQSVVSVTEGEVNGVGNVQWTNRLDTSNSVENKSGFTQVGS